MEQEFFDRSVPVFVGMGYLTHVKSVPHAHALLSDWPLEGRDAAHLRALQACRAAMAGELKAGTARRLFEAFAENRGILAPDVSPLVAAISTGTVIRPG